MQRFQQLLGQQVPLKELDCGSYGVQKLRGMTFRIRAYEAQGLGHVSVMEASGFFGLMKMDTLIVNPTEVDLPLLSYDRVNAMGNDTLIFELYDTLVAPSPLAKLEQVKKRFSVLPDHDLGSHWYDGIKLPVSLSKKGRKAQREAFDRCALAYFQAYLEEAKGAGVCCAQEKREKASVYVEGLLKHGGPSTDVFLNALGRPKTEELFRSVLFGTAL